MGGEGEPGKHSDGGREDLSGGCGSPQRAPTSGGRDMRSWRNARSERANGRCIFSTSSNICQPNKLCVGTSAEAFEHYLYS